MTESQKTVVITALIVVACGVIYGQTASFDFINIDDRPYIWENAAVQSGLNGRSIAWAFTSFYSANWHPLTWLSHMVDVDLFGEWPGGHHLTNAVLHTINSLLVFFVFRSMTGSIWKCGIVALLFAVHPAHVESVAWVAERKDVLSTMFWLLTMLAYARYAQLSGSSEDHARRSARYMSLAVVILFALGLMAKPMLVTLPFVLILCDYWPLGRLKNRGDLRPLLIEKVPLFVLTIVSSVITVIAQGSAGATASLAAVPVGVRLANAVISYGRYIRMLFYPAELGIWYPLNTVTNPIALFVSGLLLLIVTVFVWRFRRGNEYLLMGWLWFLGTLVPVIGLVQVGLQSHADRYTYIPYIGLFIMLTWGVAALVRERQTWQQVAVAAAGVAILALTVVAYRQTSLWRTSESLYSHTLSFTQNNYFLMSNLCLHYLKRADTVTADRKCSELLGSMPPSVDAFQILGYLKMETGKYEESVRFFREALRLNPASGQLRLQLSQALARQGNTNEAEQMLERGATASDPDTVARTSAILAASFAKAGRKEKAIEYYQKALVLKPDLTEAGENLEKLEGR